MRKYFDSNAEAVVWAMRRQKNGWFTVVDQTERNGAWFVDVYRVESEPEPYQRQIRDLHPSNYTEDMT